MRSSAVPLCPLFCCCSYRWGLFSVILSLPAQRIAGCEVSRMWESALACLEKAEGRKNREAHKGMAAFPNLALSRIEVQIPLSPPTVV